MEAAAGVSSLPKPWLSLAWPIGEGGASSWDSPPAGCSTASIPGGVQRAEE